MQQDKIQITLISKDGQKATMEKVIDIDDLKDSDETERQINKIIKKSYPFLMKEIVKKNRKLWWPYLWRRILALFAMGPLSSRSLERLLASSSEDKNL